MSLIARYQALLATGQLQADPHQQQAIEALEALRGELQRPRKRGGLWRRKPQAIPGLYLWGGVGRGKTWLMDQFFQALDLPEKRRLHFHHFMRDIHLGLERQAGKPDPLDKVAAELAREVRVLCLDEFAVIDIGDAMILAGLLRALFEQGITLVTTSNVPPEGLYASGIQRASFLPAIALLERHTRVRKLDGERDYRQAILSESPRYYAPIQADTEERMRAEFRRLAAGEVDGADELSLLGRVFSYRHKAEGLIWFDFEALCGPPRSQRDYLELAREHHTLFLSDVPNLGPAHDDMARRFIYLIDELYDRRVKLVMSAPLAPERLYSGERLAFEFQRTASRLREMQTDKYLAEKHLG